MDSSLPSPPVSQTINEALQTLAYIATKESLSFSSPPPLTVYGTFLGVEKSPDHIFMAKTMVFAFLLQPVLLYTTWYFAPSLTKNRKGLSWVLTFYSSIVIFSLALLEIGYMRTTLPTLLGLDTVTLGLPPDATVFTQWAPRFYAWVLELGQASSSSAASSAGVQTFSEQAKDLVGHVLRWLVDLPIFGLSPVKPGLVLHPEAPYYLGGGGHVLFSWESYPHETWPALMAAGYFCGYSIGDLLLGWFTYREQLDLASGWAHHIIYTGLIYQLARNKSTSLFLSAGGVPELSTIFLGSGNMFPEQLREEFWFPLTFFMSRIVFVGFLCHEALLVHPTPAGGGPIYLLAFLMHIFWFKQYVKSYRRRHKRQRLALQEQQQGQLAMEDKKLASEQEIRGMGLATEAETVVEGDRDATAILLMGKGTSSSSSSNRFQLRFRS